MFSCNRLENNQMQTDKPTSLHALANDHVFLLWCLIGLLVYPFLAFRASCLAISQPLYKLSLFNDEISLQ